MNDEVEKLKVQIYNSLPTCQGEDSIYCTSRTPSPVCKKAIDEILALFQKAQVEAVRAELETLCKVMDDCKDCPKDEPPSIHILAKLANLYENEPIKYPTAQDLKDAQARLTKEDGETK